MNTNGTGIGFRITALVALTMAVAFAVLVGGQMYVNAQRNVAAAEASFDIETRMMAAQMGGAVRFAKADQIVAVYQPLVDEVPDHILDVTVVALDGTVLHHFSSSGAAPADSPSASLATSALGLEAAPPTRHPEGNFAAAAPVRFGDGAAIVGWLAITWNIAPIRAEALNFGLIFGAAALVLLVLILAGLRVMLSRSVIRPIEGLAQAMQDTADGRYEGDIPGLGSGDEIGRMAQILSVFRGDLARVRDLSRQQEAETRAQTRVVEDLRAALNRLSKGDLTAAIANPPDNPFPAGYERLRQDFNAVIAHLGDTMTGVTLSASAVSDGSSSIAEAARILAERTETQSTTLAESNTSMQQLATAIRETTRKTAEARQRMGENRKEAEANRDLVRDVTLAMQKIEAAAGQIRQVVTVIDDIAFQTNLLALNAGVEAARAGDAGRGFAVVAYEVRSLAQNVTGSAQEIARLIAESGHEIERGSALVARTGVALEGIITRVSSAEELIRQVADVMESQSSGLDDLSHGVGQLEQITQKNAAMAEETTAGAEALREEAISLSQRLEGFRAQASSGPAPFVLDQRTMAA